MPSIADRVKALRDRHGLTQAELAKRLFISRDYISQIENGREPSAGLKQQVELLERVGIPGSNNADPVGTATEAQSSYGAADSLKKEIRSTIEETIRMTGDDVGKLGWLREQVFRYASTPEHWDIHEKVLADVLAEEKRKERERPAQSSPAAREA